MPFSKQNAIISFVDIGLHTVRTETLQAYRSQMNYYFQPQSQYNLGDNMGT